MPRFLIKAKGAGKGSSFPGLGNVQMSVKQGKAEQLCSTAYLGGLDKMWPVKKYFVRHLTMVMSDNCTINVI